MTIRRSVAAVALLATAVCVTSATPVQARPAPAAVVTADELPPPVQWDPLPVLTPADIARGKDNIRKADADRSAARAHGQMKGKPSTGADGQGGMAARASCSSPCLFYAVATEAGIGGGSDYANGATATSTTYATYKRSTDYHTLWEIAVRSPSNGDTVEVGYTVDVALNGDSNPHLFTYWWDAGTGQCYNGCGITDITTNPINAGAGLPKPVNKDFRIGSDATTWYFGYDGSWTSFLLKSAFSSSTEFGNSADKVATAQYFWEVAAAVDVPCTDMGSGYPGSPAVSQTTSAFNFTTSGTTDPVDVSISVQGPNMPVPTGAYSMSKTSATSVRGGGPGWVGNPPMTPGTIGGC
jgi:hypothetical protein